MKTVFRMFLSVSFLLILLGGVFGQMEPFEGFSCDRFSHVVTSCNFHGSFGISFSNQDDGVTTGAELLPELYFKCSNQSFVEPYQECLNGVIALCPNKTSAVLGALAEKLGFFCEGTDVSAFLKTMLQSGFSYSLPCDEVLTPVVNECALEILSPDNMEEDMTLATAPKMMSVMFTCIKERFSAMPAGTLPCGSSREDIVLRFWIQVLSDGPLGYSLPERQRNELQKFIMKSKKRLNFTDIIKGGLRKMAGISK